MATNHVKLDDWQDRLNLLIRERSSAPFDWGTNDCMMWAADCIEAQSGTDDLAAYRGKYRSSTGALRALRKLDGVAKPIELMDKLWGERLHISSARLGDLVVVDVGVPLNMGPSVGLCYGRNSLFVGTDEGWSGLVSVPTLSLEHCYHPWALSPKASSQ